MKEASALEGLKAFPTTLYHASVGIAVVKTFNCTYLMVKMSDRSYMRKKSFSWVWVVVWCLLHLPHVRDKR